MVNLLKGAGKKLSKAAEQSALYDEAIARLEEMFGKYAGAKPNVPQVTFPRAPAGRQTVDPAIERAIADKGVKDKMLEAIQRGRHLAGWYNMEPTRLLWGDISGPDIGTQRFNRLQDYMGPTSSQSPVDLNVGNASRWNYYDMNKLPPDERLVNIPHPEKPGKTKEQLDPAPPEGYGSKGQIGQFKSASSMLASGQPLDPIKYPKTSRYAGDLKGNTANAAMDAHATRAPLMLLGDPEGLATSVKLKAGDKAFNARQKFFDENWNLEDVPVTWWKDVPPNDASYYALEDYYKMLGREVGLDPAEAQASGWVGNAGLTGVKTDPTRTAQELFNTRVANQAVKRNMDPRDILTRMMTGQGYLGLGGAALVGDQFLPGGDQR